MSPITLWLNKNSPDLLSKLINKIISLKGKCISDNKKGRIMIARPPVSIEGDELSENIHT